MSGVLKEDDVRRMRELSRKKELNAKFEAMFYGVSVETIRRAVRGDTFTKLEMSPAKSEAQLEAESLASLDKLQRLLRGEKERREAPTKMLDEIESTIPRNPLDE